MNEREGEGGGDRHKVFFYFHWVQEHEINRTLARTKAQKFQMDARAESEEI